MAIQIRGATLRGATLRGATQSLLIPGDSLYPAWLPIKSIASGNLQPELFVNINAFFAPTVTRGTVTLTPSLYSDADTFFAATVSLGGGTQTLLPSLYTDADTFFAPAVVSSYTLIPSLYSDADTFFAPTVTRGTVTLTPSLYSDADTFFAATIFIVGDSSYDHVEWGYAQTRITMIDAEMRQLFKTAQPRDLSVIVEARINTLTAESRQFIKEYQHDN
jgi:hypothetical protein